MLYYSDSESKTFERNHHFNIHPKVSSSSDLGVTTWCVVYASSPWNVIGLLEHVIITVPPMRQQQLLQ